MQQCRRIFSIFDAVRKNIFESNELQETTEADGKKYIIKYYNLDAIIAVGYRVNSKKATMFRIWANRVLKSSS